MNKSLFTAAPFFLTRVSIWPVQKYHHILGKGNWQEALARLYQRDELFREAIAIASPSLYQSLKKTPYSQQVFSSLLNYAIRMATRSTPFGLFSFVTMGHWGEKTKALLKCSQVHKRARPDMEWIYLLVNQSYQDESHLSTLSVCTNPLIWIHNGRAKLDYIHKNEDQKPSMSLASINVNRLISSILSLSKGSIPIHDLVEKLQTQMPFLEPSKVKQVIRELLSYQFLVPGAQPSLLDISPFNSLLFSFPSSKKLKTLSERISIYNQGLLGTGETCFLKLQKKMQSYVEAKHYLQVDAGYQKRDFQLSNNIRIELEKALNTLWKLSAGLANNSPLKIYHMKFLEKYGTQRTVPLLEMLSKEKGLGSFLKLSSSENVSLSEFAYLWEKWLNNAWQECLLKGTREIILSETFVDHLLQTTKQDLPDPSISLDVFCKIIANAPKDIDNGKFLILFLQASKQGGGTFGRFFDLFTKEQQASLSEFFQAEEKLYEDSLLIELSYWPKFIRSANVAVHPSFRKYYLDIEEKKRKDNSICLEDIYVGATQSHFYLTLKTGKVNIEASMSNLLNLDYAPLPIQFMRNVTLSKYQSISSFFWMGIEKTANFLPRVSFQKTILSPAKWKIEGTSLQKHSKKDIEKTFAAWADQWNLPKRSLLSWGDQTLLLDRDHSAHLHEILHRLKKGESLLFTEHFEQEWVKTEKGIHTSELVIPFTIRQPNTLKKKHGISPLAYSSVPFEKRWKLPGSDWLFIKLYLSSEDQNLFLLNYLVPLIALLKGESKSNDWFFIRNSDPKEHIRFRLQINPSVSLSKILSIIQEVSSCWMEAGLIKDISLASYEREIERYGGISLIEYAEMLFCADSEACMFQLQAFLSKECSCAEIVLYALSVINFLRDFGLSREEMLDLLQYDKQDRKELKGFREHKKKLLDLLQALEKNSEEGYPFEISTLKKASIMRMQAMQSFKIQAQNTFTPIPFVPEKSGFFQSQLITLNHTEGTTSPKDKISAESIKNKFPRHNQHNSLFDIYRSILHMHCNRIGCSGNTEQRAMLFAYHALIQQQIVMLPLKQKEKL